MKFILIDAMGLVFRAYHAMSKMGLQAPNGELTSAVFGFGNILSTILTKEKPDYICIAFDTPAPTFRHERFEQYKAHRPEFPQDLVPQLGRIKEMIAHLNIKQVEMPGYEADDIIGTLALRAADAGFDVYCVTSDKDYCQLVGERVRLLRPGFSMGEYDVVDVAGVHAKFGVQPDRVVDVLALIGDSSDNVPGVKGIGEKTGIPLVQEFGSVEALYERLPEVSKDAVRKKLEADREMAFLSKELVTIHTGVPLDVSLEEFVAQKPDTEALREFFTGLGFRTMLAKFIAKEAAANASAASQQSEQAASVLASTLASLKTIRDVPHEYVLVDTPEKLDSMIKELQAAPVLAFDLETTSLDTMRCEIVGVALCAQEGRAFYVPIDALEQSDDASNAASVLPVEKLEQKLEQTNLFDAPRVDANNTPVAASEAARSVSSSSFTSSSLTSSSFTSAALSALRSLLENPAIAKIGQNAKFDTLILRRYGIEVAPVAFDTMLASYVLNPSMQHGMDALSAKWLQYSPVPISALIGEKKKEQLSMRDVAVERVAEYAAEDADVTFKLYNRLRAELEKENLLDFAKQVEMPLVEVLTQMEFNGIAINTQALAGISALIRTQTEDLTRRIYTETTPFGVEKFNVDSPKQLGEILFDKMSIPPVKKTKTGFSTDSSVLEELASEHPIAELVLEYRQLTKLQSTYVETLPKLVNERTGRIHTTYNQTVATTGRLSSTDPNLQNIPIRTELGREIRKAFIAQKPENILLSADYSQIELRIMAHICGDETLVNAFQNNLDIHAATASTLFGVDVHEVDKDQRRVAKTVNFGVMYGLGAFGLAQRLKIPRGEGKAIIDNYFAKYPRIKEYIDSTIAKTRETGFAVTLLGRRAYYSDITSNNRVARTAAERAAINMPIQGTAADMMKLAMIAIHREMQHQRVRSQMLLQIHDELVFEVIPEEREMLPSLVKSCMEAAFPLGVVPVVAEVGLGSNWAEAH